MAGFLKNISVVLQTNNECLACLLVQFCGSRRPSKRYAFCRGPSDRKSLNLAVGNTKHTPNPTYPEKLLGNSGHHTQR